MLARNRFLHYLIFFVVLALMATACVRPLSRDEGEADQADADIDVAATVESAGEGEEASGEEPAADEPEPAGEAPAVDEGESETDEAAAEETTDEPVTEGEDSAETEEPAEAADTEEAAEEAEAEADMAEDEAAEADEAEGMEAAETEDVEADMEAEAAEDAMDEEAAETEAADEEPTIHVVQAGENLYRIGLQYNVPWIRLAEYNGLANANYIQTGQELEIPPATVPPSEPEEEEPEQTTNYTVQAGDNLYRIGLMFDVSWVEIAEANGIVNPNQIYAGQVLKIPTSAPGPAPEFTHDVQQGESLYRISLRYGVHWRAVAEANDLDSPYVIYPGQTLVIPGG